MDGIIGQRNLVSMMIPHAMSMKENFSQKRRKIAIIFLSLINIIFLPRELKVESLHSKPEIHAGKLVCYAKYLRCGVTERTMEERYVYCL